MKRDGGDHLEHGDRGTVIHLFDMFQRISQRRVRNQLSGNPDALVEAHQVRRGIHVHAQPCCLRHGADESAGATLAVGAGDMNDRWQAALGMAKFPKQRL